MKTHFILPICLALYGLNSPILLVASGGAVINGSFELGAAPGTSTNLNAPDSTTIQGWTVTSGSIDYIGSRWVAGDGSRCLDLSGLGPGSILQTVTGFVPGQQYELSFLLAGNPEAAPTIKTLRAGVGSTFQTYTFDNTGRTTTQLGWTPKTLDFIATSSSMDVTFASQTSGFAGPAIDKVSISPILLSVNNTNLTEGNSGTNLMVFTVSLASPSSRTVSVSVLTANGLALSGEDFLPVMTNIVFLPGVTQSLVAVPIIGDTKIEPDETFFVCLTNPVNASLDGGCGIGLIINDDTNVAPAVTILSPTNGEVIYTPPGVVPITANAQDSDGFVQKVDFYSGTNYLYLGTATNTPFTLTLVTNLPNSIVLTAVATDNAGAMGTSAPVHVSILTCSNDLRVIAPLSNQTACICETVMFSVGVASSDPVGYVWKLNDRVIPGETKSGLLLQSLGTNNAGLYSVEATSSCKRLTNSATLTIGGQALLNPLVVSNASPITIPDVGNATPYPSTISVKCVPGTIRKLTITLNQLNHTSPDDIEMMLAGPTGMAIRLMSDAGGSFSLSNIVLTFDDTASGSLPDFGQIDSGSYKPTSFGTTPFPSAPSGPYATNLSAFNGTTPDGTWSLYVFDDATLDSGSIDGGWSMAIEWDDSAPRLLFPSNLADGRFQVILASQPGRTHLIEASTDLQTWLPLSTNTMVGTNMPVVFPNPQASAQRFFRVLRCPLFDLFASELPPRPKGQKSVGDGHSR